MDPESIDALEGPLMREREGKRINPFRFLSLGIMAYLGNDRAGKFSIFLFFFHGWPLLRVLREEVLRFVFVLCRNIRNWR